MILSRLLKLITESAYDNTTVNPVLFITTNDFGFGGSEDLWVLAAIRMADMGYPVAVSVRDWSPEPDLIKQLARTNAHILRRSFPPTQKDFESVLNLQPLLAIISQGSNFESLEWMKTLSSGGVKYINIIHCVHEALWPGISDELIQCTNNYYQKSLKVFFVSEGNRRLHEKMTGLVLDNADIVRNPFKVNYNVNVGWPEDDGQFHLACVGRMECFHKGWDLLLEVLSLERWQNRNVIVHFYGDGPHIQLLKRLTIMLKIRNVVFEGHCNNVEGIWQKSHLLIQPSRLEGLPLTVVEAMLCRRPVVATDVAGHREVILDEKTGFLAKAATAELLAEAMERAWAVRVDWCKIGEAAGSYIRQLVSADPIDDFIRRLEKDYSHLMGKRPF
jgi:glycosyltransferase involved in cell wall biosynthesis